MSGNRGAIRRMAKYAAEQSVIQSAPNLSRRVRRELMRRTTKEIMRTVKNG